VVKRSLLLLLLLLLLPLLALLALSCSEPSDSGSGGAREPEGKAGAGRGDSPGESTSRQAGGPVLPPLPPAEMPPPLGPPPDLPKPPADAGFAKDVREELDDAVAGYPSDQVRAYLLLKDALDRKDKLTDKQKQYLQTAVSAIEERAQQVLSRDVKVALAKMDVRGGFLAASVAGSVGGQIAGEAEGALRTLKSRLIAGYRMPEPVFSIAAAKAKVVEGPYTEGSSFAGNQITLTPKSGFRLVRVTAKAKSISQASDPGYAMFLLGRLGRLGERFAKTGQKARRLVDDCMVYLVPRGGEWVNCAHVCEGCSVLRNMTITIEGKGMFFAGRWVAPDESFDLDVLFNLPAGQNEAQFVLLGAQPVRLVIE